LDLSKYGTEQKFIKEYSFERSNENMYFDNWSTWRCTTVHCFRLGLKASGHEVTVAALGENIRAKDGVSRAVAIINRQIETREKMK
jgi:hypothetical protein